jgi:hypothetical protein
MRLVGRINSQRCAGKGHGREPTVRLSGGSGPKEWLNRLGQMTSTTLRSPPILARVNLRQHCPALSNRAVRSSFPKNSGPDSRRQKQLDFRQHFLKRLPEPHGQRSFRPNFSTSCLVPWTMRRPRFTFVSDGKPLRRLLIVSENTPGRQRLAGL